MKRRLSRRLIQVLTLSGSLLMLTSVTMVSPQHVGGVSRLNPAAGAFGAPAANWPTLACSGLLNNSSINETVALVFAGMNFTENETMVDRNIAALFDALCALPTFQGLIATETPQNFSFGMFANRSGPQVANFTISWEAWAAGALYQNSVD